MNGGHSSIIRREVMSINGNCAIWGFKQLYERTSNDTEFISQNITRYKKEKIISFRSTFVTNDIGS